ncbi:MAG: protein translocase subunit SecF [Carboxydocellales bacterium]
MNIMGLRKIWYAISLTLIIPGIVFMFINYSKTGAPLNLGIDFTGGTMLSLQFDKQPDIAQIRKVTDQYKFGSAGIQSSGDNQVLVRVRALDEKERGDFLKTVGEKVGTYKLLSEDKVGPVIGKELTQNALLALGIAAIIIVIYITIRFEIRFAIAAIIALLHDVLVVMGIFAIFRFEVDSAFVAAILTIIGYSINDTIVIFDRIRENLARPKKGESLEAMVNNSIMQTMTRSINTVLTVLFVLVSLLFLGGETLKYFVLAMLIGVISGAYSSIFNASPLWVDLKTWFGGKQARARA